MEAELLVDSIENITELWLDQDGDGEVDTVAYTEDVKDDITYDTLKDALRDLPVFTKYGFILKVGLAEKAAEKGRNFSARFLLNDIRDTMDEYIHNDIHIVEDEDALRIIAIVDVLLEDLK